MEDLDLTNLQTETGVRAQLTSVGTLISEFLKYLFPLAGLILLLYLLAGGFQLMTSAGDPKKMQEAKSKITNALVGFIIVFAAYWLVQIAGYILGLEAITNIFG